jgi:hypothetical protein
MTQRKEIILVWHNSKLPFPDVVDIIFRTLVNCSECKQNNSQEADRSFRGAETDREESGQNYRPYINYLSAISQPLSDFLSD